jgi:predicted GTPase
VVFGQRFSARFPCPAGQEIARSPPLRVASYVGNKAKKQTETSTLSNKMKVDDITQQLGETLKKFLGFFTKDLHKKVLELDTNVKSKEYFEELTRVSNSLEQYIQKDVSLFYVGFLGSYSSGKSSTINSLLHIWNTDKARLVNNNPTDTNITLITNQKNVQNVFTFAKEGAIPIRTNTNFDIEFLDDIVLMDTPGSGDPNIIESIVRDSLPLCDLIIYTLNATAPFTDIDKPFLMAQQNKLKNIPLLFVLTRADEYKINESKKLSIDNFNIEKSKEDLTTIVNRINEAIEISNFNETDFTLIDNKDDFNIN